MELNNLRDIAHHCLHLCNSTNVDAVVFSYAAEADAFVTNNPEMWKKKLEENGIKCLIKSPGSVKQGEKVVVDGSSFGSNWTKWEKKWEKQQQAVCIYNIDGLDSSVLKEMVAGHGKMILSIDKIRILSNKNLEKELKDSNQELVESAVKKELRNIVISLLLSSPMSGAEIVKVLYEKFRVFISPGMLYPALHELEKTGLLEFEYKLKNKIYRVKEKHHAEILLKDYVKVNSLLSQVLVAD